jgi:hypothetical protein
MRQAARRTLAALAVFALGLAAAAAQYPGGSWSDRSLQGFSLWRNFWCDLLRSQAINGADNAASRRLSGLAFAALAAALWWYWRPASALAATGALRGWVLWLGRASTLALVGMALLPSDAHPVLHGAIALVGAGLGIGCAGLCIAPRLPEEKSWSLRRVSGAAALLFGAGNAGWYVYVAYLGGPETPTQPVLQKLATLALLVWMLSTLRRAAGPQ